MEKKKNIDVPDIDEKEFLDMMANNSLQDRLARKREQTEIIGGNELSEPTLPTEIIDQYLKSEEALSDRPSKKSLSGKQRKASLQEYRRTFLGVPKIMDRKTVFISNDLRERVVEVILRLGTEKSSVSGFVENLVKAHLSDYEDDINAWKKL